MNPIKHQMTLARMKAGQTGIVVHIAGGHGLTRRLQALGIRPGKKVAKMSSMFRSGPVTVQVDNTQIALGFGISNKITVEVDAE